eukprot:Sspe_Gene.114841::Locus_101124_Transcript_1_1_Confidence_1.000_Length_572::g.114841::m.114841
MPSIDIVKVKGTDPSAVPAAVERERSILLSNATARKREADDDDRQSAYMMSLEKRVGALKADHAMFKEHSAIVEAVGKEAQWSVTELMQMKQGIMTSIEKSDSLRKEDGKTDENARKRAISSIADLKEAHEDRKKQRKKRLDKLRDREEMMLRKLEEAGVKM